MKLLVVDDDPHIRRLLALLLREHEIAQAATGQEALDHAARQPFDVALVDLILPEHGGLRLCRKLKEAKLASRVVVMSGDDSAEMREQARAAGADGFLAKPFTPEQLSSSILR